jgi:hypothetical protein
MYFIANIQPRLLNLNRGTGLLTVAEKKNIIEKFEQQKKLGIPLNLCEDHGDGKEAGFVLKKDDIIGNINELILNEKGELIGTGELHKNNEHVKKIIQGMFMKKSVYGVSLWLDLLMNKNSKSNDDLWLKKELNHVALTTDPALGKYGSYIFEWSPKKERIDEILKDKYFNFNDKNYKQPNFKQHEQNIDIETNENLKYASKELIERWVKGIFLFIKKIEF